MALTPFTFTLADLLIYREDITFSLDQQLYLKCVHQFYEQLKAQGNLSEEDCQREALAMADAKIPRDAGEELLRQMAKTLEKLLCEQGRNAEAAEIERLRKLLGT